MVAKLQNNLCYAAPVTINKVKMHGLFAKKDIKKGQLISEYIGPVQIGIPPASNTSQYLLEATIRVKVDEVLVEEEPAPRFHHLKTTLNKQDIRRLARKRTQPALKAVVYPVKARKIWVGDLVGATRAKDCASQKGCLVQVTIEGDPLMVQKNIAAYANHVHHTQANAMFIDALLAAEDDSNAKIFNRTTVYLVAKEDIPENTEIRADYGRHFLPHLEGVPHAFLHSAGYKATPRRRVPDLTNVPHVPTRRLSFSKFTPREVKKLMKSVANND